MITDEKITQCYMTIPTFLTVVRVRKNGLSGYHGTNGGKVSLKVVGSNQSTNNDNQNGDGSGKLEKKGSVYYRYNDGNVLRMPLSKITTEMFTTLITQVAWQSVKRLPMVNNTSSSLMGYYVMVPSKFVEVKYSGTTTKTVS